MDDDIQLPHFRTLRMSIIDTDPVHSSQQDVKVFMCPLGVSLFAEGYDNADRTKLLVFLRQQRGELVLYVHADINRKEPTHVISLGRARESNRHQQGADTR